MSEPVGGGPAFPYDRTRGMTTNGHSVLVEHSPGMSLRDWFAGQMLAGWAADPDASLSWEDDDVAARCYEVADAMLAERDKGDDTPA